MSAVCEQSSLRRKLLGLAVACSLISLAVTAVSLGVYEWYSFRRTLFAHLDTVASLTARMGSAALAFEDREDGARVLLALDAEPAVEAAAFYGADGELFASYLRPAEAPLPPRVPPDGAHVVDGRLWIVHPVVEQGRRFGSLVVRADVGAVGERLTAYSLVLFGTILASCFIALLLTRRLQRGITEPVLALAEAAAAVQTSHDYRLRVPKQAEDEIGALTDAFNGMLARVQAHENELQRSADRLRLALDAGRIGTFEIDPEADRMVGDPRLLDLLGLPVGKRLPEEALYGALHPEDRLRARGAMQEAIVRRGDFSLEVRVVRPDGAVSHLSCRGRAIELPGGVRVVAVAADITERRRAELQVLESERRFRAVAEKAPALIWSCDRALERDYFNATWLAFTGRALEKERGRGWLEHMAEEDRPRWLAAASAAGSPNPYTVEYRLRRADGAFRWLLENAAPRFAADGAFAGYLGTCVDITASKETEAELETRVGLRTRQLEAANHDLGSFSYSVSHDLRAPVRLIHGFAEIAIEECEAGRASGALAPLRSILRSAGRMNQLIEAFISLARITQAELRLAEVDLSRLAQETVETLRLAEPRRQVDVKIQPDLRCQGDARLLRVLLDNLIGNAWKFSSRQFSPSIEVGAEEGERGPVFFVRDNGVGFDEARAERLFQPFNRMHSPKDFDGVGVGLNTVLRIVQRHDGRVWARSQPGAGATFYFSLPARGAVVE